MCHCYIISASFWTKLEVDTLSYKTLSANKETSNKEWLVIDAENQVLGRLASQVALLLRGKHKPMYGTLVTLVDKRKD